MITVTIAGRPNVGKSTLFNALAGRMIAITDRQAGTTRDLIEAAIDLADEDRATCSVRLIDAGGIGVIDEPGIAPKIEEAIRRAITAADVIIFVVDARTGITDLDQLAAERMRRLDKPVILAANKCENEAWEIEAQVFGRLGLGQPILIAAQDKKNLWELMLAVVDAVKEHVPDAVFEPAAPDEEEFAPFDDEASEADASPRFHDRRPGPMRLAILGRRNVGKSTFVNAVAGEDRCIVSEIPGTTRDAIDVELDFGGERLVIIDTAGIVRRREGSSTIEFKSTVRTERAIKRADIVMLFTDCTLPVGRLERDAFRLARERYKPTILVVNKWDLSTAGTDEFLDYFGRKLHFTDALPVAFISSVDEEGVSELMAAARELFELSGTRLGTGVLNRTMRRFMDEHGLPLNGTRTGKVYYAVQTGVHPPEFTFFVNYSKAFGDGYLRYLRRRIAAEIGSEEVPVRIILKAHSRRRRNEKRQK